MRLLPALIFLTTTYTAEWIVLALFSLYGLWYNLIGRRQEGVNADKLSGKVLQIEPEEQEPKAQEIIRLSPPAVTTSSAEMSQQQKIAAALAKAGITNSWEAAGKSKQNDAPEPPDSSTPPSGR